MSSYVCYRAVSWMKSKKDFNFFWKWKKSCGSSIFSGNGKNHAKNHQFSYLRPLREERRRRIELRARCCWVFLAVLDDLRPLLRLVVFLEFLRDLRRDLPPPWRLVEGGLPLGERIDALQQRCGGAAAYDRLDLRLPDMAARERLEAKLAAAPPSQVAGSPVLEVITTDGVKLRLGPSHWLMLRFSGTEPLLRLYCEAPTVARVNEVLIWARELAEAV